MWAWCGGRLWAQDQADDGLPHGWQARLRGRAVGHLFSPLRRCQTLVLQERERDQAHQGVAVQAGPGAALEVIEAISSFSCWCACSQVQRALMAEASAFRSVSAGRLAR